MRRFAGAALALLVMLGTIYYILDLDHRRRVRVAYRKYLEAGDSIALRRLILAEGCKSIDINTSVQYKTALHLGAGGDLDLLNVAIKCGADLEAKANPFRVTALHLAVDTQREDLIKALIAAGADPNAVAGGEEGFTPLMQVVRSYSEEDPGRRVIHSRIIQYLLANGADANTTNAARQTALMLAAATGDDNDVRLLVTGGANPNARDRWGTSVLSYALCSCDHARIRYLVSRGAVPGKEFMASGEPTPGISWLGCSERDREAFTVAIRRWLKRQTRQPARVPVKPKGLSH